MSRPLVIGVAIAACCAIATFVAAGTLLGARDAGHDASVMADVDPETLDAAGRLVADDCAFSVDTRSDCLWFWPTRQDAGGNTALPVTVLRERSARRSRIASIYLMGGPGGAVAIDDTSAPYWVEWRDSLALDHDLVLYDQRGSTPAWPEVSCPGYLDVALQQLGRPADGEAAQTADLRAYESAVLECATAVPAAERASGLYSTATHRADLVELMQSLQARLGYRGFVLYGASYGSRLALETARVAPPGLVWRVVLDAFYTPGIDLDVRYPRSIDEAVRDFEQWCAGAKDCDSDSAFGDRLQAALDRAAREPRTVSVDLGEWDPEHPSTDLHVDATGLLAIVVTTLSYGEHAAGLPAALDDIAAGRWTPFWDTLAQQSAFAALDGSFNPLAFHLVECRDNAEFDRDAYLRELQGTPRFARLMPYLSAGEGFCGRLGVTPEPLPTPPSDVDALVTSMQVEPVTPWRAARDGLALLRHAEWRVVRGVGHVVANQDECAATAIGAYMNSGALDAWDDCDLIESARFERGIEAAIERDDVQAVERVDAQVLERVAAPVSR